MTELVILAALGMMVGSICWLSNLYEQCLKELEAQNKEKMVTIDEDDYVYMDDGTPVKYDEDTQE